MKYYIDEQKQIDFISSLSKSGNCTKLLDIGYGEGYHAEMLQKEGFEVTGLDPKSQLSSKFESYNVSIFDFQYSEPFDMIYCISPYFFDQWNNYKALFRKVKSLLRPDGIFLLDFFDFHKYEVGHSFQTFKDKGESVAMSTFRREKDCMSCDRLIIRAPWERKEFRLNWKVYDNDEITELAGDNDFIIDSHYFDYNDTPREFDNSVEQRVSVLFKNN